MFAGNVAEGTTLEEMLKGLAAPAGALVILDRGIATEANIASLKQNKYRYLVVSRERARQFDPDQAIDTLTASQETIRLQRVLNADGEEVRLYCHSAGRETKETAIATRFAQRFEAGLAQLAAGLSKPRGQKRLAKIFERIGRLKQKSRGASQHYEITVTPDETGSKATAFSWKKAPIEGSMLTHPGSIACAATRPVGMPHGCGRAPPCSPIWRRCSAVSNRSGDCDQCSTTTTTALKAICSSPCWPINWCRRSASG
jgi:hypothetical protein